MQIIEGGLNDPEVIVLLQEHLRFMRANSPPDGVYALDLEGLAGPKITFWTAREDRRLLACGALQELTPVHGEIKSMRTAPAQLGRGVASALLRFIIAEAEQRGYERLSLETGSGPAFEPAQALYRKFGFTDCGPFADYPDNSFSRFMTLRLPPG